VPSRVLVWVSLLIGSTIGRIIPAFWRAGMFSYSSLLERCWSISRIMDCLQNIRRHGVRPDWNVAPEWMGRLGPSDHVSVKVSRREPDVPEICYVLFLTT
jgi:hypothetical protein